MNLYHAHTKASGQGFLTPQRYDFHVLDTSIDSALVKARKKAQKLADNDGLGRARVTVNAIELVERNI